MRFFEDYEANERAIKISEGIEMISVTIATMVGIETDVDINNEIISNFKNMIIEEPTIFAKQLMDINIKSLGKIKDIIGQTDQVYNHLSDATAICIIGILNFPINEARLTLRQHNSQNTMRGIKLRTWVNEAESILKDLKYNFYLSTNAKEQTKQCLSVINNL